MIKPERFGPQIHFGWPPKLGSKREKAPGELPQQVKGRVLECRLCNVGSAEQQNEAALRTCWKLVSQSLRPSEIAKQTTETVVSVCTCKKSILRSSTRPPEGKENFLSLNKVSFCVSVRSCADSIVVCSGGHFLLRLSLLKWCRIRRETHLSKCLHWGISDRRMSIFDWQLVRLDSHNMFFLSSVLTAGGRGPCLRDPQKPRVNGQLQGGVYRALGWGRHTSIHTGTFRNDFLLTAGSRVGCFNC